MVQNKEVTVKIVDTWDHLELAELYRAGGWWDEAWDPRGLSPLIDGSFALAIASVPGHTKAVGMGRVISDGVSDAYIQDLAVLPEWRGVGIGCMIVEKLVEFCKKNGVYWISLIAEPGTIVFYEKLGFRVMNGYVPLHYEVEH